MPFQAVVINSSSFAECFNMFSLNLAWSQPLANSNQNLTPWPGCSALCFLHFQPTHISASNIIFLFYLHFPLFIMHYKLEFHSCLWKPASPILTYPLISPSLFTVDLCIPEIKLVWSHTHPIAVASWVLFSSISAFHQHHVNLPPCFPGWPSAWQVYGPFPWLGFQLRDNVSGRAQVMR